MDAHRAGGRLRPRAVPKTQTDSRALVRQHQTQQRLLPLPPTRQDQGAPRVAITDDDPQPDQGSPPPTHDGRGLNGPPPRHTAAHGGTRDLRQATPPPPPSHPPRPTPPLTAGRAIHDRPPAVTGQAIARAFERQPPWKARVRHSRAGLILTM